MKESEMISGLSLEAICVKTPKSRKIVGLEGIC